MRLISLLYIYSLLYFSSLYAAAVSHLNRPKSSILSLVSQGACSTYRNLKDVACNPAIFPYQDKNALGFQILAKAEGDSIETGKNLLFKPIDQAYMQTLFTTNNYTSFSLNSDFVFYTGAFNLDYSPYYLLADVFVNNPSYPEISLFLVKQQQVRLLSGYDFSKSDISILSGLSFGGAFSLVDRKEFQENISLSSLAISSANIINYKRQKNLILDSGISWKPISSLPTLSWQVKNLLSKYKLDETKLDDSNTLEPYLLFETYSQLGLGHEYSNSYGSFNFGIETFFKGLGESFYTEATAANITYSFGGILTSFSYSQYFQTTGFYFSTRTSNIGMVFAKEKEMGNKVGHHAQNSVYLKMEITL